MLTVKIKNGDENERTFYVKDVQDVKSVQYAILDDFQKVLAQDKSEDRIMLERLVDLAGVSDADDLEDWIKEAFEIKDALDSSDYDSIDEMTGKLEDMSEALSDIYNISRDYY